MSGLAFVQCVFYGWWSGELARVQVYMLEEVTYTKGVALATNGFLAFALNLAGFTANRATSALTMSVAGESLVPAGFETMTNAKKL